MKINTINTYNYANNLQRANVVQAPIRQNLNLPNDSVDFSIHNNISFKANPIEKAKGYFQYLKAQKTRF